jgi:YD repeat-containing protein
MNITRHQRQHRRRLMTIVLCGLFLAGSNGPLFLAAAAPQLFFRPGAGVSRLPLGVSSFGAPGFGQLEDAVNLANGSVYVSTSEISRNNISTAVESVNSIGNGGWNLSSRLRLSGTAGAFSKAWTAAPATMTLGVGDGSVLNFGKVTVPNLAWFNTAPSWIQRYKGSSDAVPVVAGFSLYSINPQAGTQYNQEWVVLKIGASSTSVAHYYSGSGTRSTFFNDGEYTDDIQDLYQQYRGAKYNNDPEGTLPWTGTTGTPKTEITYTSLNSGLISKVKDEWGRVTTYEWNTTNKTLNKINYLLRTETDNTSFARQAVFTYILLNAQQLVSNVTYNAPDGRGGSMQRQYGFNYALQTTGRVVLSSTNELSLGIRWKSTFYTYDAIDRLQTVSSVAGTTISGPKLEPDITYTYNSGGNSVLPNTTEITIIQGSSADVNRKESRFYFDPTTSQLLKKRVRDYNPWAAGQTAWFSYSPTEKWLETGYSYFANGSTQNIVYPSGRKDSYTYDAAGNVSQVQNYKDATTLERSKTFTYDRDNRQTLSSTPAVSGTRDGVNYSYSLVDQQTVFTDYSFAHTSGQVFTVVNKVSQRTLVASTERSRIESTIDELGRVTESIRSSTGLPDKKITLSYYAGTTFYPWIPTAAGSYVASTLAAKQYGDLVAGSTDSTHSTAYQYDELGHANIENRTSSISSDNQQYGGFQGSEYRKDRVTMSGWNGFDQPVFQYVYEYGRDASKKQMYYYGTGEADWSWDARPENVTDYRYDASMTSADFGRLIGVVKGDGATGSITTQRSSSTSTFDTFGRVATNTIDAVNTTTLTYDTLDRVVNKAAQDGTSELTTYSITGIPDFTCFVGGVSSLNTSDCHYKIVDSFGRTTSDKRTSNGTGHLDGVVRSYSTLTTFDPFDRPIKVQNDALTSMSTTADDRSSYMVYDSLGNLIKDLRPVLRGGGAGLGYGDNRRPYTELDYDKYNRLTTKRELLKSTSPVLPSSISMPAGATIASSSVGYDSVDRAVITTDPDGYTTELTYDGMDNVTSRTQLVCKLTESECLNQFVGEDAAGKITTRYTYDAKGRVTSTKDPRGNTSYASFNLFGQPTFDKDARGITVKAYTYTNDGLLDTVYEPDNDAATPATAYDTQSITSGYKATQKYVYGNRVYPTSMCKAFMDVEASQTATAACRSFTLDWAGRATVITLPDTTTIEQDYDARGNIKRIKDAAGFITESTYDAFNRLVKEYKPKRLNNAVDNTSFPNIAGLESTYIYDNAGNQTKKVDWGIVTEYGYNTRGLMQNESRPVKDGVATTGYKWYTYRTDGQRTAQTTYDYGSTGNYPLVTAQFNTVDCTTNKPTVPSGNVVCWELSAGGKRIIEASFGISSAYTNPTAVLQERIQWDGVNGLGLRYARNFTGDAQIYAAHEKADGTVTTGGQGTLWSHDANGNLLGTYKRATGANNGGWTDTLSDANEIFKYAYTKSNQQIPCKSEIKAVMLDAAVNNEVNVIANSLQGVGATATACETATNVYNERDQLDTVEINGTDVRGLSINRTTIYKYYADGSKSRVDVAGQYQTFVYDKLGRLTSNFDSSWDRYGYQTNSYYHNFTTNLTYFPDGSQKSAIVQRGYDSTIKPTLGGLIGEESGYKTSSNITNDNCPTSGPVDLVTTNYCDHVNKNVFNVNGQLIKSSNNITYNTSEGNITSLIEDVNVFDNFTNKTSVINTVKLDQAGVSLTNTTNTITYNYNSNNKTTYQSNGKFLSLVYTTYYDGYSANYLLDSQGNRIKRLLSNSLPQDQRFNSDGLPDHQFENRANYNNPPQQNLLSTTYFGKVKFIYDPFRQIILSAYGRIWHNYNQGVVYQKQIYSKFASVTSINGSMQLEHSVKHQWDNAQNSTPYITLYSLDQDENFGVIDGIYPSDPMFDTIAPFSNPDTTNALAAPVTPTSVQTGVTSASSVTPPTDTPSSPPASNVTPPTDKPSGSATNPGNSSSSTVNTPSVSSQSVSSPALGVTSGSNTTSATPATSNPSTSTPSSATTGGTQTLQSPTSVAPGSVAVTGSSVTNPNATTPTGSLPGGATSVTKPDSSVPPSSSTPTGTGVTLPGNTPPSGIPGSGSTPPTANPNKPVTNTGTQIRPMDYLTQVGNRCVENKDIGVPNCDTSSLKSSVAQWQKQLANATDPEQQKVLYFEIVKAMARIQDTKFYDQAGNGSTYLKLGELVATAMYKSLSDNQKVMLFGFISLGMRYGGIGADELGAMAAVFRGYATTNTDWGSYLAGLPVTGKSKVVPTKAPPAKDSCSTYYGTPNYVCLNQTYASQVALQVLSTAVGFIPIVGDVQGIVTAVTGRDPISGQEVTGLGRWLGLLGLIGLAEVASAARAGRLAIQSGTALVRAETAIVRKTEGLEAVGCALFLPNSFPATTKVWVARAANNLASKAKNLASQVVLNSKRTAKITVSTIAISTLAVGTQVLAYNENTNQDGLYMVTDVRKMTKPAIVHIEVEFGKQHETIDATPGHPFWVKRLVDGKARGKPEGYIDLSSYWVSASNLKTGDIVSRAGHQEGIVRSVKLEAKQQPVYDLTVKDAATFYVGDSQLLVHNCSPVRSYGQWRRAAGKLLNMINPLTGSAYRGFADLEANHLFQTAAFKSWWGSSGAPAMFLRGGTTDVGGGHWAFHVVLENLWDNARAAGTNPTVEEYLGAVANALRAVGYKDSYIKFILDDMVDFLTSKGRTLSDTVPRIPDPFPIGFLPR